MFPPQEWPADKEKHVVSSGETETEGMTSHTELPSKGCPWKAGAPNRHQPLTLSSLQMLTWRIYGHRSSQPGRQLGMGANTKWVRATRMGCQGILEEEGDAVYGSNGIRMELEREHCILKSYHALWGEPWNSAQELPLPGALSPRHSQVWLKENALKIS